MEFTKCTSKSTEFMAGTTSIAPHLQVATPTSTVLPCLTSSFLFHPHESWIMDLSQIIQAFVSKVSRGCRPLDITQGITRRPHVHFPEAPTDQNSIHVKIQWIRLFGDVTRAKPWESVEEFLQKGLVSGYISAFWLRCFHSAANNSVLSTAQLSLSPKSLDLISWSKA